MRNSFYGIFQMEHGSLAFFPYLKHTIPSVSVTSAPLEMGEIFAEEYENGWTDEAADEHNLHGATSVFACNADLRITVFIELKELVLLSCPITEQAFEQISALQHLAQLECIYCEKLCFFAFLENVNLECFILVTENMQISLPSSKPQLYVVIIRGSLFDSRTMCGMSRGLMKMLEGIKGINNSIQLLEREDEEIFTVRLHDDQQGTPNPLKSQFQLIGKNEAVPRAASIIITEENNSLSSRHIEKQHVAVSSTAKPLKPFKKGEHTDPSFSKQVSMKKLEENAAICEKNDAPGTPATVSVKAKPRKPKKALTIKIEEICTNMEHLSHKYVDTGAKSFFPAIKPIKPSHKREPAKPIIEFK